MTDYEYIESLGCYGQFHGDVFQRMVEARREVWYGADGSGLITSQRIRSIFFTDAQRQAWETSPHPPLVDSMEPSLDLFAAGCLPGPRAQLARLAESGEQVAQVLDRTRRLNLHGLHDLLGEALVPAELRAMFFELAAGLAHAEVIQSAQDQLGRVGIAVARVERLHREELIFDSDSLELLGYRQVVVDPDAGYAPVGAVVGWSSYVRRDRVDRLPDGTPPVPEPPCYPPGAGRGTVIGPGLILGTGAFADLKLQLDRWLAAGVITESQREALAQDDEVGDG